MLLVEVSVWEPIGRVRLASASVNSGCGVTSLSRNAHWDAPWLANWHPDCVLASRGLAVLSGRARWFFRAGRLRSRQGRGDPSTDGVGFAAGHTAWASRRATRHDLGRVMVHARSMAGPSPVGTNANRDARAQDRPFLACGASHAAARGERSAPQTVTGCDYGRPHAAAAEDHRPGTRPGAWQSGLASRCPERLTCSPQASCSGWPG
jgi:hypothetical protein